MKKILFFILLIASTASLSAQNFQRRGFSLGADRDTLMYIIASPFDNWYVNLGGGLQTFIGNELDASARSNKLNFNLSAEIGKWIIPDLAVSLRLNFMSIDGQSRYPLQPFIDYTGVPTDEDGNLEYQPFHAYAVSAIGFVTLDWTNFFHGYEAGKRRHLHWFTPIGLGASMLFGEQKNPNPRSLGDDYELGDFRRNFELAYSFRVGAEYIFSKKFAMNATLELFGSESTWDWSPYDNSYSIFDIIPSFNIGVKLNLLKTITKYDPYTHTSHVEKVNHEFLAFGTRNTVSALHSRIEQLNFQRDSLSDLAGVDARLLDSLQHALDSLQQLLVTPEPQNVFDELLDVNEILNLPATIVYFQLDKYDLDYNGRKRLEDFAKEARQLDDTVEFYIIGAADSLTGSIRHNQWLSEKRAGVAFNALVNDYGVNANQLIRVFAGGITEYDPNENNRMAMLIQRTSVTEEIVERWKRRSQERLR